MDKNDKIFVAGHNGLIGSAVMRRLLRGGYTNVLAKSRAELDLTDQHAVKTFFEKERPEYVFFAAARVGGVFANNTYRAEFLYENLMMQNNVLQQSFLNEVRRLIFFASADVYPKDCPQPAKEEYLLTGALEPTCEPFALAKIAGIKLCESFNRQYGMNFIVVIPPNVYGPNQRYDIMNAQVLPSLIKKFHDAKISGSGEVFIWGSGTSVRDFLFVDDVADASVFLMEDYDGNDFFNIGTGHGYSIRELAEIIKETTGYEGDIIFDRSKPDGVAKKLLDISKINSLGWSYKTELIRGVKSAYQAFIEETEKKEVRSTKVSFIDVSERDAINLKQKKEILMKEQPDSYKNIVVIKPWGHEYLIFENDIAAVWFLHIKKGFSTSMHCHPGKKTSLIVLSGSAMSNTFQRRSYLRGGEAVIIEKGVFHSTKALSDEGICLLEIETPPNKTDLLRLEDRYGRASSGYEGLTEMRVHNPEDFDYFYFEESDQYGKYTYTNDKFSISFEVFPDYVEFKKQFKIKNGELYASCRGMLYDEKNNILLNVGNTQKAEILSGMSGISISEKTVLLRIASVNK